MGTKTRGARSTEAKRRAGVSALAALIMHLTAPTAARAQIAEFMGPHEMETLELSSVLVGTGRIGGITADSYGYLYVANQDEVVWKIHPNGEVEEFMDGMYGSAGGVMLPGGVLLHSNYAANQIFRVERDGTRTLFADEGLSGPVGMTITDAGVFVANCNGGTVSRITLEGEVSEFLSDERLQCPNGITQDRDGNLYVVNLRNTKILKVTPDAEISEIATLPGSANAHVVYYGGALYVTQIWNHVVLRVEMDGSWQVVAGDGTYGLHDGVPGESRVSFPNGIAAVGDRLYFNTMTGNMIAGHMGTIQVHRLHVPSFERAFFQAWEQGGREGLKAKFEQALELEEATLERIVPGAYGIASSFFSNGMPEPGMALIGFAAEVDPDEARMHEQLGRAHSLYGDADAAVRHFERGLELSPDSESMKLGLEATRRYRTLSKALRPQTIRSPPLMSSAAPVM